MNKEHKTETNFDKKLSLIVLIATIVAISIIVLVNIPWNGESGKIAKQYEYLTSDNVFDIVEAIDIDEMIEKEETFHLYIGNKAIDKVNYFVYYANQLAKEKNVEKIYYLESDKLTTLQLESLREKTIAELSIEVPNMIYFSEGKCDRISSAEDFESIYGGNYWLLLKDYFDNTTN